MTEHGEHTAEVSVRVPSLIDLNRDNNTYKWADIAVAVLGNVAGQVRFPAGCGAGRSGRRTFAS